MPEQLKIPEPPSVRNVTLHGVEWSRVLEFTQLFRGFRLAINPAKILIAILAIVLIYASGRAFDGIWGPQVYVGEIESYQSDKPEVYSRQRTNILDGRKSALTSMLLLSSPADKKVTSEDLEYYRQHPRSAYRQIKSMMLEKYHEDLNELRKARVETEKIRSATTEPATDLFGDSRSPKEIENEGRLRASRRLQSNMIDLQKTVGQGIFDSLLEYEIRQFDALVNNTLTAIRIAPIRANTAADLDGDSSAVGNGIISTQGGKLYRSDTVLGCVSNMVITGPTWLFCGTGPMQWRPENAHTWGGWIKMVAYRGMYLLSVGVMVLFWIAMIAMAGGMICRMSALEIAGVERAPLSHVFRFVRQRWGLFIKLPLVPFLIVLALGLGITALGLVGAIPVVGEILLGLFFIVALAIAFVAMLLLLGILGGFNLLFPTLAVEGSDVFDAMSRAFAYVYARPWRLLFYTVVSLVYGVLTLLFVCFAVYLVLAITHVFAGWGTNFFGQQAGWYSGAPKLDTLWPAPRYGRLISPINWWAMSWPEYIGALALHFWVFMLISAIGAYVVSYYYTVHTMIYMLIRRSVDGQAIEEVFLPTEMAVSKAAIAKEANATAEASASVMDGPPPS